MIQCPQCGASIANDVRFCPSCGANVGGGDGKTVIAPPQPAAPAAPESNTSFRHEDFIPGVPTPNFPPGIRREDPQRELMVNIVDVSGSMAGAYAGGMTKLVAAMRAGINMVSQKEKIDPLDEIGLVTFNHDASVLFPISQLATSKAPLINALQSLTPDGGTDINKGLKMARELFDWSRQVVTHRIVLLTDGHGGHPIRTAEDLKSRGVIIDVIGVGDTPANVDEKLLRKVASVVDGELRYRFIKDSRTLVDYQTRIAGKTVVA